jgi:proteasome activator subunit 4
MISCHYFDFCRDKTFSKRGFSWSGKLLSSTLLTLTHTYPLENKFVNPEEWASDGEHYFSADIL